jgi:UDP-N-acetylmuramoyl-L-alanyl-D-glutamate--2,6-diaminopimelate ligase
VVTLRPTDVPARPLAALLATLDGASADPGAGEISVTGVTHDSRAVRPGDLYVALPGARAHGAEFVPAAVASGAVAVLTDRPGPYPVPAVVVPEPRRVLGAVASWVYGDPSADLDVVGITGTNGKTTSAYLVEAGFRAAGRTTGLIGTIETRVAGRAVAAERTTPEATELQALFAVMRERGVSAVATEVSSHGLALGRVDGTRYDVAVFTNLSQDHLDFHADLADYFEAKALLFDPARSRVAVVNVDDDHGVLLRARTRCPVVTTSAAGAPGADWRASRIRLRPDGTDFVLHGPGVERPVRLGLAGRYNVDNALGAVAALVTAGIDVDAAVTGVASLTGVPGRLERVDAGQPFLAVVDYAHSPDSVASVLRTLRPLTDGAVIVVLGCGGDRDHAKRPLMGAAAAEHADVLVATSDNPRSEDPLAILAAFVAGARDGAAEVVVEPDRAAAIDLAVRRARPGDTVVVAGKGHEQGQTFADRTVPFDDRVELRAAIERARA